MRSIRRRLALRHVALVAVVFYVGCRIAYAVFISGASSPRLECFAEGRCDVVEVLSSDCVIIRQALDADGDRSDQIESRLKLIGIQPAASLIDHGEEREPKAKTFTIEFLATDAVHLRLDKRRVDEQGRLLGYLYVEGKCLNEELAASGLVQVSSRAGDNQSIARRMRKAASLVQQEHRGIR